MDPAFAEVLSSFGTAFAVVAVFAALFVAVVGMTDPRKAEVPPSVQYLAALGIIVFLFGQVVRYVLTGY